jgi:GNAT superfamily N-acetyltransferase
MMRTLQAAQRQAVIEIRDCHEHEIGFLGQIEERADAIFPDGLISENLENYPLVYLERARTYGSLLVACNQYDIVGFAVAEMREDSYHLFLLAVLPEWGRQGIGSALLDRVSEEAKRKGLARLTLTTFSHIEWNAPYYQKKGFEIIPRGEASACLQGILKSEAQEGFANRVAMQRLV